jgi:hypothetical protein
MLTAGEDLGLTECGSKIKKFATENFYVGQNFFLSVGSNSFVAKRSHCSGTAGCSEGKKRQFRERIV